MMKNIVVFVAALCMVFALSACKAKSSSSGSASDTGTGGTGGSTAPTALVVAQKVTVVDAKLSGSVAAAAKPISIGWSALGSIFNTVSAPSASSDYNADRTQVYVDERSTDQMNTINQILCMVGQTKYDAKLNTGNYVALVDNNQCNSNNSNASAAGAQSQNQSSGATMPNYYHFTVNSSRPDNSSPEIVKIWVHQPADNNGNKTPALIYAKAVITESTSSTNPYGIFTMNFAGFNYDANGNLPAAPSFKGALEAVRSVPTDTTSKVLLKFASSDSGNDGQCGAVSSASAVALDRLPDGSAGSGHTRQNIQTANCPSANGTTEFNIAYNSTDFFRQDLINTGLAPVCLSRANFDESAWNYSLYDAVGARVQRNSGFSITYGPSNQYQGYISYWGVWTNNNAPALTNGQQVNKVDYNNGSSTSTPFTIFEAGGKLHKHVRKNLTLGNIVNVPLSYWEQSMTSPTGTNYQVLWDGAHFNKVAFMPQNCGGNCAWANLPTPYQTIDVTHLAWQTSLNFWSDSLSGQVQVPLSNCTYTTPVMMQPGYTACDLPTNNNTVIFYTDTVVYPGDTVPGTLQCYDNCLNSPTTAGVDLTLNMGYISSPMSGPSMTPVATNYAFNSGTMTLMLGSNPVTLSTVTASQQWGIMSGPLFDPTTPNLSTLLACPWNPGQICSWQAMSTLPVFFTWETGPNNWNQFIGVKDANNAFVRFDAPLQVQYVDGSGTTFMLQYGGFGQLNGIPGKCVNMDTGADADCSAGGNGNASIRWVPQFIIPPHDTAGNLTTVSVTDPTTNAQSTCFVKPLQVEQRMKADPGACSFASTVDFSADTLPDMSIWSDPAAALSTEPTVTAAPAVIGGVVQ